MVGQLGVADTELLVRYLDSEQLANLDEFDKIQLAGVIYACQLGRQQHKTQAEMGRQLFAQSRKQLKNPNDSDRLRKFLLKFGLKYEDF